jgi:hypothetical protein
VVASDEVVDVTVDPVKALRAENGSPSASAAEAITPRSRSTATAVATLAWRTLFVFLPLDPPLCT